MIIKIYILKIAANHILLPFCALIVVGVGISRGGNFYKFALNWGLQKGDLSLKIEVGNKLTE